MDFAQMLQQAQQGGQQPGNMPMQQPEQENENEGMGMMQEINAKLDAILEILKTQTQPEVPQQ